MGSWFSKKATPEAGYELLISEVLDAPPPHLVLATWTWCMEPGMDDSQPTTAEVMEWVWVGYDDEEGHNVISLGEQVKGMVDTGLDEDEDVMVEVLKRTSGVTLVQHEDREVYYLHGPRLGPSVLAVAALEALQAGNAALRSGD